MKQRTLAVLITGSGNGLGQGLSVALAEKGHRIFATDCLLDSAKETVSIIESKGGQAYAHRLDVTRQDDVQEFLAGIGNETIDVLINNAGLQHIAKLEDFPQEKWDLLIDVMLKGAY